MIKEKEMEASWLTKRGIELARNPMAWNIVQQFGIYTYDGREYIDAGCACNECRAGQRGEIEERKWGQGHFVCEGCPDSLLEAEDTGIVGTIYHGNKWRWFFLM